MTDLNKICGSMYRVKDQKDLIKECVENQENKLLEPTVLEQIESKCGNLMPLEEARTCASDLGLVVSGATVLEPAKKKIPESEEKPFRELAYQLNWPKIFALVPQEDGKGILKTECTLEKSTNDSEKAEANYTCFLAGQNMDIPIKKIFDHKRNEWGPWEYRSDGETIKQRSLLDVGLLIYFDGKAQKGFPYDTDLEMEERVASLLLDHHPLPTNSALHWLEISKDRKSVRKIACTPNREPEIFLKPTATMNQNISTEGVGKTYSCRDDGKDRPVLKAELILEKRGEDQLLRLGDFEWSIKGFGEHLFRDAVKKGQNVVLFKYPRRGAFLYKTDDDLLAYLQKEIFPQVPDLSYSISEYGGGLNKIFVTPIACDQKIIEEPSRKSQRVKGFCQFPDGGVYSVLLSRNYKITQSGDETLFSITDWQWKVANESGQLVGEGAYVPQDVTTRKTLTFVKGVAAIEHDINKPEEFATALQEYFRDQDRDIYRPELLTIGASLVLIDGGDLEQATRDSKGTGVKLQLKWHPLGALFVKGGMMWGSLGKYDGKTLMLTDLQLGLGISLREFFGWSNHFDLSFHADVVETGWSYDQKLLKDYETWGWPQWGGCLKLGRFNVCLDHSNPLNATLFSLGIDFYHRDYSPQIVIMDKLQKNNELSE